MVRLYGSAGLDASAPERVTLARQRARAAGVVDQASIDAMAKRMSRVWRLVRQEEGARAATDAAGSLRLLHTGPALS